MGKLPVMAAVRSADAFRRLHARDAIGALTLTAVSAILMSFGNAIHGLLLQALGMLGELAGGLMAMGALLRVAFADEHPGEAAFRPGPYGLQWRNTEWRLLGAGALVLLLCLLAALAATALAFAVLAGILLATGHGLTSQPMSDAGMIATGLGAVGGLYVAYRLILSMPATVSRQKITVLEVWSLTRGQVLRIFGASLVIFLVLLGLVLILVVVTSVIAAGLIVISHAGQEAAAVIVAVPAGALTGLVMTFLQIPLTNGLYAYLYRGLRPPQA